MKKLLFIFSKKIAQSLYLSILLPFTLIGFEEPKPPEGIIYHHDVEIGNVGSVTLKIDIATFPKPNTTSLPCIVYIHGGAWNRGNKNDHAKKIIGYTQRGFVGASLMYRLAPTYNHPTQVEDVKAAIRFLKSNAKNYHIDPTRIVVWGASAGGHLASMLGVTGDNDTFSTNGLWEEFDSSVAAVVNFSGPNSNFNSITAKRNKSLTLFLGDKISNLDPQFVNSAMPISFVNKSTPPFFIAHGTADRVVPVKWSRDFVYKLQETNILVQYEEFEGAGHRISQDRPQSVDKAFKFIQEVLNKMDQD